MDLPTQADIDTITSLSQAGPAVSLYMPTHRSGPGVEGDPKRWKNLVNAADAGLAQIGMRRPDIDALLGPARALQNSTMEWQYMGDGLAMFLRPGWEKTLRMPLQVPEIAAVGDKVIVSPLLRYVTTDDRFFVLTVSQRLVRLLAGTGHGLEEVVLDDVPTSLRDVIEPLEPRSDTMTRPVSGGRARAVFYGHGAADDDFKKEQIQQFLDIVAHGLGKFLADQNLPVVLVGLPQMIGAYRVENTYQKVLDATVQLNPDPMSVEELHAAAWPILQSYLDQQRQGAISRFEELNGTGKTAVESHEVETSAAEGRIDTLFVSVEPSCWDSVNVKGTPIVVLGTENEFSACEALDAAAVNTLAHGGKVYSVPSHAVPGRRAMSAILRY